MKKKCDPPLNAPPDQDAPVFGKFSRRSFLTQLGAAGLAATAAPIAHATGVEQAGSETSAPDPVQDSVAGAVPVTLRVNGTDHRLMLEPRVTLLDALRENLQMFGTKKGCDHGHSAHARCM